MSVARRPKMWVKWRLRLPRDWRVDVHVLRHGRCTPDECGYGNVWCRNGCKERVWPDDYDYGHAIVRLDNDPAGGEPA